jgi:hypothetical protein
LSEIGLGGGGVWVMYEIKWWKGKRKKVREVLDDVMGEEERYIGWGSVEVIWDKGCVRKSKS